MSVESDIQAYLKTLSESKRLEMETLHNLLLQAMPNCKLWFLDGRNSENKVVTNPNIGYGSRIITYADGKTKEFYQIGLSANTSGISVYILGLDDKLYLVNNYAESLGKASITGYCIKFKRIENINVDVLIAAVLDGIQLTKSS